MKQTRDRFVYTSTSANDRFLINLRLLEINCLFRLVGKYKWEYIYDYGKCILTYDCSVRSGELASD